MVRPLSWMPAVQAADVEIAALLERIMWAQTVIASILVLALLAVVAMCVAVLLLVRRAMNRIEAAKDQILPHVTPVLNRASTIADDVGHIAAGLRDDADAVHEAVHDVVGRTRNAVDNLEDRVRRFGAVVEAVQGQAELLLMDAAATARGVHEAARALRDEPAGRPRGGRRQRHDSTGQEP